MADQTNTPNPTPPAKRLDEMTPAEQRAAALGALPKPGGTPRMKLVGSLADLTPAQQRQAAIDAMPSIYGDDDDNGPKAA